MEGKIYNFWVLINYIIAGISSLIKKFVSDDANKAGIFSF